MNTPSKSSKILWGIMSFFSVSIVLYSLIFYGHLDISKVPIYKEGMFPQTRTLALFIHIFGGILALLLGPFQFSKKFRAKHMLWHRRLGKIYFLSIVVGGVTGLVVSFYADGGLPARLGFGTLAVLWLVTAWKGFTTIKKGQVAQHQVWMIRNFALTFAAVTLRIHLPLLIISFKGEFIPAYQIVSWLCWVPNLLIAEWLFVKKQGRDALTSQP